MSSKNLTINQKQLVLIGGGHSHAIALHLWHKNPLKNTQIILISDVEKTPYSGMLPGYIAGYYTFEQTHINLVQLAQKIGIKLIIDKVTNIDSQKQKVICESGKIIDYDLLSIDIGSTPNDSQIKGSKENAIPAKPVPILLEKWQQIINNCKKNPQQTITINIIGSGAGGIELALNIQHKLQTIIEHNFFTINLIGRNQQVLKSHNNYAKNILTKILKKKKINIFLNSEVAEILSHKIIIESGLELFSTYTFLVTNSAPAKWLKATKISTDDQGFILVKDTLQTLSHDNIFATGDIATMTHFFTPKAGVFAVRQGKPLYKNWCKYLTQKSLQNYHPQSIYLSLIGTGNKKAVAVWGILAGYSGLFWYIKDYIDRKFMEKFKNEDKE